MQICLNPGMSPSCEHPFLMERAGDTLIIKVLSQTAKDILSLPTLFSYILAPGLILFRQTIFILSLKTCKIILICPVKLIFSHKIPHKPLICRTPSILTKLPKVIKKKTSLFIRLVLHFPFKWSPHFWRSRLCSSGGSQTAAICDTEQWSEGYAYNRTFHQHNLSGSSNTKLGFQK